MSKRNNIAPAAQVAQQVVFGDEAGQHVLRATRYFARALSDDSVQEVGWTTHSVLRHTLASQGCCSIGKPGGR